MASDTLNSLDYHTVDNALQTLKSPYDASEVHGLICGYLCCTKANASQDTSLKLIFGEGNQKDESMVNAQQTLFQLYQSSQRQLEDMNFSFLLLLPSDDDDLRLRAKALGAWCRGFHSGQMMAQLLTDDVDDEQLRDALFHISEIAKLDYESLDISDEDERSYTEVLEYVRVAVLMVYTQVHDTQQQPKEPTHQPPGTLH